MRIIRGNLRFLLHIRVKYEPVVKRSGSLWKNFTRIRQEEKFTHTIVYMANGADLSVSLANQCYFAEHNYAQRNYLSVFVIMIDPVVKLSNINRKASCFSVNPSTYYNGAVGVFSYKFPHVIGHGWLNATKHECPHVLVWGLSHERLFVHVWFLHELQWKPRTFQKHGKQSKLHCTLKLVTVFH